MSYIKEPKGVDLVIPPSKLTKKDAIEISLFIEEYKKKKCLRAKKYISSKTL